VVDKPADMVVHVGAGHERGTLVNAVLHHLGVGPETLPVLPGSCRPWWRYQRSACQRSGWSRGASGAPWGVR